MWYWHSSRYYKWEFTCKKNEYFDPIKTFLHNEIYCQETCEDYWFLCGEKGFIFKCEEYNLFLYDNKCYKQCLENSGLIADNIHVCCNYAELWKSKVNNFYKKCTGNECIEDIYDDKLINDEPEEEEIIEKDFSKLYDNYLRYNRGSYKIIDNVVNWIVLINIKLNIAKLKYKLKKKKNEFIYWYLFSIY